MNINFIKMKGVIQELRLLRAEISRLADLKELELQSVHRITTRVTSAAPADLANTAVSYADPEYADIVEQLERTSGRKLDDAEAARIAEVLDSLKVEE